MSEAAQKESWEEKGKKALERMRQNHAADIDLLDGAYGIEKQRWHIWALHAEPKQCMGCGKPVNLFQAADDKEAAFAPDGKTTFHCPHCKYELIQVVPMVSLLPWHWQLAVWPATGERVRND